MVSYPMAWLSPREQCVPFSFLLQPQRSFRMDKDGSRLQDVASPPHGSNTMRNMSFALTKRQVRNKTKSVTRRFGWWFLEPGDLVQPVEKGMGLKKGEKIKKIGEPIRILSSLADPLGAVTPEECVKEGFPELSPLGFLNMLRRHYKKKLSSFRLCNRIEFEYTEDDPVWVKQKTSKMPSENSWT